MDQTDITSTVLSSLSFVVSVLTACLSFFSWWQQRKEHVADVKKEYSKGNVADSVEAVADVLQRHKGSEHEVWDVLYHREPTITTAGGTITRRELLQHMRKVDEYWDDVITQYNQGRLPGFFKPNGGWLARADNYRRLFEPLFIANYYHFETTPYLKKAGDGGASQPPLKRPARYWRIEQLWVQMEPGKPQYDSTVWAQVYEQQKCSHQGCVDMQGISREQLKQPEVVVGKA